MEVDAEKVAKVVASCEGKSLDDLVSFFSFIACLKLSLIVCFVDQGRYQEVALWRWWWCCWYKTQQTKSKHHTRTHKWQALHSPFFLAPAAAAKAGAAPAAAAAKARMHSSPLSSRT